MERLRQRYDAYCEERARDDYLFLSGRRAALEVDRIDQEFGDVTGGDALEEARRGLEEATGEATRQAWRRLGLGLQEAVLDARVRRLSRELREREAGQGARVDADERRVFEWQARLEAESDAERRRRIDDAIARARAELNPLREELFVRTGEALREYGYDTPRAWAEARHEGIDYAAWEKRATRFLEATETGYRDRLARALAGIGVAPGTAGRGDMLRAARLPAYDADFPGQRIRAALDYTTEGLGIRLDDVPGIEVDDALRPGKNPRACCVAERLPGAVWLVVAPRGGLDDWEAFFHESGHALHCAFTSPELPVERRRVGDPALTETWAFLLQYRISDPRWVGDVLASPRAEPFARDVRFRKLALLRRYAAKIRFECRLNELPPGAEPRGLADLYEEELTAATGFWHRATGYLADTDPFLYSVDYFRAWCLEVQLAEALRVRYGSRFWREKRCGDLLKELWNTGGTYGADELASELDLGAIDADLLIEECS